ncbi:MULTISPECIES: hypothetical protein [unclassified Streptomyces]|uniref:hypothetical protein n=1 Tax=unclassified Streptomyces TaxID=2593676 RepID=UPI00166189C1|nr:MULTISPECIES: hypothetical protein [unclassified Streptomyces]MBD0709643.1 hypothetical protein [Streptomyces sp. CBMA291]MBD0713972.1 hypothetical protein [Streptomyces sp. CBMA370]MBD0715233.1 hypothetical protein [Streptomyces sp. CBMA370]
MKRITSTTLLATGALLAGLVLPATTARADDTPARVDLRVLVVTDGGPATQAIAAELETAGTPYTEIDLNRADRPVINAAYLSDTVGGRARAKFQAVVLPNDNPFPANSAEMTALAAYEQTYGIPQVDAYTYARPEAGLQYPVYGGYSGSLDGVEAQVTTAGRSGAFGYLAGAVPFEDNSPTVGESYAYLSTPVAGADFTPYVEAPIPGTTKKGSLVGEYRHGGRRELVVTFVYNRYQQQFRLLARGIVDWMTGGVHLGASRNYFAVHVDDVFAADDRWNSVLNCTPGDVDCTDPNATPDPIRMTAADVDAAVAWQNARGLKFDLAYNAAGSVDYRNDNNGADPLADRFVNQRNEFRWINHTYTHAFLGCEQDISVVPWRCATLPGGSVKWVSRTAISDEISVNRVWGQTAGLPLENGELVTGEHSGLRVLPQQTADNPNLALALADNSITWLGSDNSRETGQRQVGPATTVPRYPMNIFYNAGRAAEQVDEYNWIYTSRAQGGSGICEDNPATTTCLPTPLDPATGYTNHIVPLERRIALGHVLANDPKPHFIHQSNLAEDRIAYPVLDGVLDTYQALFAASTPVVNLRMKDIGRELQRRTAWQTAVQAGQVTAYRIGDTVTVEAPAGLNVPATMPTGTLRAGTAYAEAYAGTRSGWTAATATPLTLTLPAAPAPLAATGVQGPVPAPAPAARVPAGVLDPVTPGTDG